MQKHAAQLWVKTHHFDEKDMSFLALAYQLGRLPGIQHTIKALPELGTGAKAMSQALISSWQDPALAYRFMRAVSPSPQAWDSHLQQD